MNKQNILVVCYGNACRSPMLQAILQKALDERGLEAVVESAGLLEGKDDRPASEPAQIVAKELGFDLSGHRTRAASSLNPQDYDRVFCVERKLAEQLVALGFASVEPVDTADVPNPYERGVEVYRETASVLQRASATIADRLAHEFISAASAA